MNHSHTNPEHIFADTRDTNVSFDIALDHSSDVETSYILESMESSASLFLDSALSKSNNTVKGFHSEGIVELKEIQTVLMYSPTADEKQPKACGPSKNGNACTLVKLIVTISHQSTITEEEVRFQFLQYYHKLSAMMSNAVIKANYRGPIPANTTTIFVLSGVMFTAIPDGGLKYFENSVEFFLKNMFALSSVQVHNVHVIKQEPHNLKQRHLRAILDSGGRKGLRELKRRLESHSNGSTLEITTTILGEYIPPPFLDLGSLIDEIFEESGEFFIEGIEDNRIFEEVHGIHANSITQHYSQLTEVAVKIGTGYSIFHVKEFSIPFFVMLSFVVVFIIIFLIKTITQKKSVVRVLAMEELMERRDSLSALTVPIETNGRTISGLSIETKTQKSNLKSLQLRSEERVYSVTNLSNDQFDSHSRMQN